MEAGEAVSVGAIVGEAKRANWVADAELEVVSISTCEAVVVGVETRATGIGELRGDCEEEQRKQGQLSDAVALEVERVDGDHC